MSSIEPFTPEGIDPNSSYLATCINRVNTNYKTAFASIPDVSGLATQVNTNTANIANLTTISNNNRIIVNVKDYGAIGNDIADDTSAINSAISALSSSAIGITLYFPRGTYRTSGMMKILNRGNLLILSDGASIRHTTGVDCLHFDGCNNLKMSGNLYIFTQTTGLTCQALVIRGCSYTYITGLHIGGDFLYGIHCFEDNGFQANYITATIFGARNGIYVPRNSEYFYINNCVISLCDVGVRVLGANIHFANCEINENRIGVIIEGDAGGGLNTDHASLSGCIFNHNKACGIYLKNLTLSTLITGCQIWANNGPNNLTEASNSLARNYHYGIYIEKGIGVSIIGNVIAHNNNIELAYDSLENSIINNNLFRSVPECSFPIYEFYTAGTSYKNNQICNNIFYGTSSTVPVSSSLLRIYVGNMANDGASNFIVRDNTGDNKNNDLLMAVNSGDYYIGLANNYIIDNSVIFTTNGTDPAGQTANIYLLPHTTGTTFSIYFRGGVQNALQYIWLRYRTNNTGLAPYIPLPASGAVNIVYYTASRCFRIANNVKRVQFIPMSNNSLGNWCVVGDAL